MKTEVDVGTATLSGTLWNILVQACVCVRVCLSTWRALAQCGRDMVTFVSYNNLALHPQWGDCCLWIVCQQFKLDPPLQYLHLHRLSTILDSEDEEDYDEEALQWVNELLFYISWSVCFRRDESYRVIQKEDNIFAFLIRSNPWINTDVICVSC